MTTSMSHVDKIEIAEAFAKVEELSKACQNHLFENAVDLGKPLQSESDKAASIQHLNTVNS